MLRVEFHCHTSYSKDSRLAPKDLIVACVNKGIDRVVITDHNSTGGAIIAQKADPKRVIIGEEIMTTKGELLAFFVQEEIPAGESPAKVISLLRQQDAFISVSHPFDLWRGGHWDELDLLEIIPLVDAIETFNARCMQRRFNEQALSFARLHKLQGTAGSDSHTAYELGKATMLLPEFNDAAGLKRVISEGSQDASLSSPLVHFSSRYASWFKKLNKS
jgi:predicted metal-dependent phosphoesterase TrpH